MVVRADSRPIAPGLLTVFRQAVLIRLGFALLIAPLIVHTGAPVRMIALVLLVDSAILLGALNWPRLQRRLGVTFLPILLGMAILITLGERAGSVAYLSTTRAWRPFAQQFADNTVFGNAGFHLAWLMVPVVLAAWQYGRRGLLATVAAAILGELSILLLYEGDISSRLVTAISLVGSLAVVAMVGFVVERLADAQRREHQALEAANRQLMLRAATAEELAESRERNRLARELHDTLAHSLTGLSLQLQALGRVMDDDPAAATAQLKAAQATVREGIGEARRAIQALRATPLADLGLTEALRQLCQVQAERLGIEFDCQIDEVGVLEPLVEQAVYRVAEAALANVVQHANASQVTVRLARRQPGGLTLAVEDDGVGFDPQRTTSDRYGLAGMRERADLIQATLVVRSAPGQGTQIRLEVGE